MSAPSDDVLLELGRVVWAAINLEDRAFFVMRLIDRPKEPFRGEGNIGKRISKVRDLLLSQRNHDGMRVADWLERVRTALKARNAVVHSTPATWEPLPGSQVPDDAEKDYLLHFPSARGKMPQRLPFTVESLHGIRTELESATGEWLDAVNAAQAWRRQSAPPPSP